MTQAAINYGQVLYELSLPEKVIEDAALALKTVPELKRVLNSLWFPKPANTGY